MINLQIQIVSYFNRTQILFTNKTMDLHYRIETEQKPEKQETEKSRTSEEMAHCRFVSLL